MVYRKVILNSYVQYKQQHVNYKSRHLISVKILTNLSIMVCVHIYKRIYLHVDKFIDLYI